MENSYAHVYIFSSHTQTSPRGHAAISCAVVAVRNPSVAQQKECIHFLVVPGILQLPEGAILDVVRLGARSLDT